MNKLRNEKVDWLVKNCETYNGYYTQYKAKHCIASGLPLYDHDTAEKMVADKLYSVTRAKREKVNIDQTKVCGWYRMCNGYIPLFKGGD